MQEYFTWSGSLLTDEPLLQKGSSGGGRVRWRKGRLSPTTSLRHLSVLSLPSFVPTREGEKAGGFISFPTFMSSLHQLVALWVGEVMGINPLSHLERDGMNK